MTLYDNVCTPCVRKPQWMELRRYARRHHLELTRIDIRKQPNRMKDIWWNSDQIPMPVLEYQVSGDRVAINLNEFLRLQVEGNI